MKILITGSGGQIARELLALRPEDITVVALSHSELDVGNQTAVHERIRQEAPAAIINTAAYTAVDRAESEPEAAWRANAAGPRFLAEAAGQTGARLIQLSTDFVFDGAACRAYRPDDATNPLSAYGRTKRAGEEAVLSLLPASSVVLRTAWVYGAAGNNFVRTMLRLLSSKGAVRVVADQIGCPTAAASVAEVLWKLARAPSYRGVHHWTDAGVASWYDLAVAVAEEAAKIGLLPANVTVSPISTEEFPTAARRPPFSVLDSRSLDGLGIAREHWRCWLRRILGQMARA